MRALMLIFSSLFVASVTFAEGQCPGLFEKPKSNSGPVLVADAPRVWIPQEFKIPLSSKVSDLLDKDGYLYVFRVIGGDYVSGRTGEFSKGEGVYSYSYNPMIPVWWASQARAEGESKEFPKSELRVLVGRHKVGVDNILTVNNARQDEYNRLLTKYYGPDFSENARKGILPDPFPNPDFLKAVEEISVPARISITSGMTLKDLGLWNLYQIDVPLDGERVIGVVPYSQYENVINQHGHSGFFVEDFVKEVLDIPGVKKPPFGT